MKNSQISPLPWKTDAFDTGERWTVFDAENNAVLLTNQTANPAGLDKRRDANTAFVIKAANLHDELVRTVKRMALVLSGEEMSKQSLINALNGARTVLEKADKLTETAAPHTRNIMEKQQ